MQAARCTTKWFMSLRSPTKDEKWGGGGTFEEAHEAHEGSASKSRLFVISVPFVVNLSRPNFALFASLRDTFRASSVAITTSQ
jgi:hypothetical protein